MSRTNKSGARNPASKFIEWKAEKGEWSYYNKEEGKDYFIKPSDLSFIVLDQLSTVKGYDRRSKKSFWANEVRSTKKEKLTVRDKDGVVAEGFYGEIKADQRLKYIKSIYVMAKIGKDYELLNLQLKGSANSAWIEFAKAFGDVEVDVAFKVVDVKKEDGQMGEYFVPVFGVAAKSLSEEASSKADDMDKKLQGYLTLYFSGNAATSGGTSEMEPEELSHENITEKEKHDRNGDPF